MQCLQSEHPADVYRDVYPCDIYKVKMRQWVIHAEQITVFYCNALGVFELCHNRKSDVWYIACGIVSVVDL